MEFSQKELKVIHHALDIAAYQLEEQPENERPEYNRIKGLIAGFDPRYTAMYFCQTSILFDPPKSAEEALARYERYGANATMADISRLFPGRLDGFGLPRAQAHTATFDRVKFYQALWERYICFSPPDICADIAFLAELERSKDPVMISTIARATPPVR